MKERDDIKNLLRLRGPLKTSEIAAELEKKDNTISSLLKKMTDEGEIKRLHYGFYYHPPMGGETECFPQSREPPLPFKPQTASLRSCRLTASKILKAWSSGLISASDAKKASYLMQSIQGWFRLSTEQELESKLRQLEKRLKKIEKEGSPYAKYPRIDQSS